MLDIFSKTSQLVKRQFTAFFAVSYYTREAGVRSLERKIGGVCRAVAVQVQRIFVVTTEKTFVVLSLLTFENEKFTFQAIA